MEKIVSEVSQSAIYEYNDYIQSQKEEGYGVGIVINLFLRL